MWPGKPCAHQVHEGCAYQLVPPSKQGKCTLSKLPLDLATRGWPGGSVPPLPLSASATLSNTLNHFSKLQTGWTQHLAHMFSEWGHCLCSINLMQGWSLKLRVSSRDPDRVWSEESDGKGSGDTCPREQRGSDGSSHFTPVTLLYKVLSHTPSNFICTTILGKSIGHISQMTN